jgi:lipoate-protein ligase A
MHPPWHILETGLNPGAFNMALDEALLTRVAEGALGPVVRLYGWSPPAVTIGYTQQYGAAVDADACARLGLPVLRRITGGGAVLHEHEITYSVAAPAALLRGDVAASFARVAEALAAGLRTLGVAAEFAPINDVLVNGKKISGNAQVRRRGAILQHGTVLLRADTQKMFEILRVPESKLKRRNIENPGDRITTLENELGRSVAFDEAAAALRAGFEEWIGAPLPVLIPDEETLGIAKIIEKNKYMSHEWNRDAADPKYQLS